MITHLDAKPNIPVVALTMAIACSLGACVATGVKDGSANIDRPSDLVINVPAAIGGDESRPVVMIEVSDFECPFCARHALASFPRLRSLYIDRGLVRYAFVPFPLPSHRNAVPAAIAANCATEQGRQLEMQELLFSHQRALSADVLSSYGDELGLDMGRFESCRRGDMAQRVADATAAMRRAGVRATPTVLLGVVESGQRVRVATVIKGALPVNTFVREVDALLATHWRSYAN